MCSVCIRLGFSSNARTFARPIQLFNSIEPDFPCLADKIAEPRPDMNFKVTAFTVNKKFYYNTCTCSLLIDMHYTLNDYFFFNSF